MKKALAPFVAAMALLHSSPSMADELSQFLKITCAPEIQYFSAQIVDAWNISDLSPYGKMRSAAESIARAKLAKRRGLFAPALLLQKPYRCLVPGVPSVRGDAGAERPAMSISVGYPSKLVERDRIRGAKSRRAIFEVMANKQSLGFIDLGGPEPFDDVIAIEVKTNGVGIDVRTCRANSDNRETSGSPDASVCEHTSGRVR